MTVPEEAGPEADAPVSKSSNDGPDRREGAEREDADTAGRSRSLLSRLPMILRTLALALVVGGFAGALASGVSPVTADSAYSVAFYVGIACAVVSVYLGIFLQRSDGA